MQLLRSDEINSGTVYAIKVNPFNSHKQICTLQPPPVVKSLGLLWSETHAQGLRQSRLGISTLSDDCTEV